MDLTEQRAKAADMKDNYAEIAKVFPPFGDDYIICSDIWPATLSLSDAHATSEPLGRGNVSPVPATSPPEDAPFLPLSRTVSLQQEWGSTRQREGLVSRPSRGRESLVGGRPARSPEEEAPSISANPSEATGTLTTVDAIPLGPLGVGVYRESCGFGCSRKC